MVSGGVLERKSHGSSGAMLVDSAAHSMLNLPGTGRFLECAVGKGRGKEEVLINMFALSNQKRADVQPAMERGCSCRPQTSFVEVVAAAYSTSVIGHLPQWMLRKTANALSPPDFVLGCAKLTPSVTWFMVPLVFSIAPKFCSRCSGRKLHGILIIVEDNFATHPDLGLNTTCGTAVLRGTRPKRSAVVIDKLIETGTIVIGTLVFP